MVYFKRLRACLYFVLIAHKDHQLGSALPLNASADLALSKRPRGISSTPAIQTTCSPAFLVPTKEEVEEEEVFFRRKKSINCCYVTASPTNFSYCERVRYRTFEIPCTTRSKERRYHKPSLPLITTSCVENICVRNSQPMHPS